MTKDCSTCKYEHNDGHSQPCRDCGTFLESYTKWEQKGSGGTWIKDGYCLKCDVCGYSRTDCDDDGNPISNNFCPNCGDDKRGWKPKELKTIPNELDVTVGYIEKPK